VVPFDSFFSLWAPYLAFRSLVHGFPLKCCALLLLGDFSLRYTCWFILLRITAGSSFAQVLFFCFPKEHLVPPSVIFLIDHGSFDKPPA
jgi:hypothetical protein